jgi:hypothetical protein
MSAAEQTPQEFALQMMQQAKDSLPQCGHEECMVSAVTQLSLGLTLRIGQEISPDSMSTEMIMILVALSTAHERLQSMRALNQAACGVMQ